MSRVPADRDGWRLDRVVAALPGVGSRRRARAALAEGRVRLDGRPVGPDDGATPVRAGSRVELGPPTPVRRRGPDPARLGGGLGLLHLDAHLVAVDKPPGLLTDAATWKQRRERDTVRARVRRWLEAAGEPAEVHVVHRIDRDTSGVVLLARDAEAAERLRADFRHHRPERIYRAFVVGRPDTEATSGAWVDWMRWDRRARRQVSCDPGAEGAFEATLRWRLVAAGPLASELEIALGSGRRNQVRLQALLHRCPVVGERQYVPPRWRPPVTHPRQALHALRLGVRHPATGRTLVLEAPLPADLRRLRRFTGG